MAGVVNWPEIAGRYRTLVLEGCDGVGKSTLAARLSEEHGYPVAHSQKTPDHLDLATRYHSLLDKPGRLLFDRCFLSELVYGPLLRGRSRISWSQAIDLSECVIARSGLFVHLTAAPETVHQRLLARDGRATAIEEIQALISAYHKVFQALTAYAPVLTVDTTALDLRSPRSR